MNGRERSEQGLGKGKTESFLYALTSGFFKKIEVSINSESHLLHLTVSDLHVNDLSNPIKIAIKQNFR